MADADFEIVQNYIAFCGGLPEEAGAALRRIEEQFDALHSAFEKLADEWESCGTTQIWGPNFAAELRKTWREALSPAEKPATECHICHRRLDEPGEEYCSAAHPLPYPATDDGAYWRAQGGVPSPAKSALTRPITTEDRGGVGFQTSNPAKRLT